MTLCYQKGAVRAKFKMSFSAVGAINQKKVELQKYVGTSKEECLIVIKELLGVLNSNNPLPNNYPSEIVTSRAGSTRTSTGKSQVKLLKVTRVNSMNDPATKNAKTSLLKSYHEILLDGEHLEKANKVTAFLMLVGIIEEPTARDVLTAHLNSERESYVRENILTTGKPEFYTAPELKAAIEAVTQKVLRKDSYHDQLKYLHKTKKLYKIRIAECMRRQEFIISTLLLFGQDAKSINKKVRNEDLLIENLPEHVLVEFCKEQI